MHKAYTQTNNIMKLLQNLMVYLSLSESTQIYYILKVSVWLIHVIIKWFI